VYTGSHIRCPEADCGWRKRLGRARKPLSRYRRHARRKHGDLLRQRHYEAYPWSNPQHDVLGDIRKAVRAPQLPVQPGYDTQLELGRYTGSSRRPRVTDVPTRGLT
jgi:hypothetical protein